MKALLLTPHQITAITEQMEEVIHDLTGTNPRTEEGLQSLIDSKSYADFHDLLTGLQVLRTQLPKR